MNKRLTKAWGLSMKLEEKIGSTLEGDSSGLEEERTGTTVGGGITHPHLAMYRNELKTMRLNTLFLLSSNPKHFSDWLRLQLLSEVEATVAQMEVLMREWRQYEEDYQTNVNQIDNN